MGIRLEKMTRRECHEAAGWADRIGMFCLAKSILRALATRLAKEKSAERLSPARDRH